MCKFFRDYRKEKNLTQGDLARLLGCTQGTIGHIEGGHRKMSYSKAREWGELLGVDPRLLRPSPYPDFSNNTQPVGIKQ